MIEIGQKVSYKNQGIYKVISKQPNSRTLFEIEDIDKGKGWSEEQKKYVGVTVPNGWYLGKNHDFGIKIIVHKKYLKELN